MPGFGGNVVRKSRKSKGKKSKSKSKSRNLKAVAKFKAGDDFAMMDLAMQYQLKETLSKGSYY
ncbi:MAG: hypothetical protein AAGE84_23380 [Cyanobacteria bacterium P01_G01_bin.39]